MVLSFYEIVTNGYLLLFYKVLANLKYFKKHNLH